LYATLIPSNNYYRYKDFQIIQICKIDKKPLSLTLMSIQKLVSFTRHKLFLVIFTVGIMKTKPITYRYKLFINTQPYRYSYNIKKLYRYKRLHQKTTYRYKRLHQKATYRYKGLYQKATYRYKVLYRITTFRYKALYRYKVNLFYFLYRRGFDIKLVLYRNK
jgi:hypothetical protein